jgi:hypothetical protein
MKNIPIIIVHRGDSFYLSPVLRQMKIFNPESPICLISDIAKEKYSYVNNYDIEEYMNSANEFEKSYIHLSSNPYSYELICFQRWFIILDFVIQHQFEHFLCIDSDVLLFCDVDTIFNKYIDYDFTICGKSCPNSSLFNAASLKRFCDCIVSLYSEDSMQRLYDFHQIFLDKKLLGGVCDMTAFEWFQDDNCLKVIDISIPDKNACFDLNISISDSFEMENGKKKIYWKNNLPYGKLLADGSFIQLYCLHFQGRTKYAIYKYLLDENKVHKTGLVYTLSWMFSPGIVKARLNGVKKAIKNPQILVNFMRRKLKEAGF